MIVNQKAEEEATACIEIVMDWVDAMVDEVGSEEMKQEASNRRKLQKYLVLADKVSDDLMNKIVGEDIGEDIGEVALTAIIEAERQRQEKVKISRERLQKKLMKKVYTK
jgi:hypothetical protein